MIYDAIKKLVQYGIEKDLITQEDANYTINRLLEILDLDEYIEPEQKSVAADPIVEYMTREQLQKSIERTRKQMQEAAKKLDFMAAAQFRDEMLRMEEMLKTKE